MDRSSRLDRGGGRHPQQLADGDSALCLGRGSVDRDRGGDEALELEDSGPVGGPVRHAPGDGRSQQGVVVVEVLVQEVARVRPDDLGRPVRLGYAALGTGWGNVGEHPCYLCVCVPC